MALVQKYFQLTDQYIKEYGEKTILLMQVGEFMECYGLQDKSVSKIEDFSKICDLKIAEKNCCVDKSQVLMAGFKVCFIDKYVRKCQDVGYTVVVYTQDQACKDTTRSLAGVFSPGTYFQAEDTPTLTNNISCIWMERLESRIVKSRELPRLFVGVANVDILTGKSHLFEYEEVFTASPTIYDELERFLSIHRPSEVLFIHNLLDNNQKEVEQYVNLQNCPLIHRIPFSGTKKVQIENCQKQIYQTEIIQRFFSVNIANIIQEDHVFSSQAFCYLLDFIHQHNPNLVKQIDEPIIEMHSNRLVLGNHSLKQLNILEEKDSTLGYSTTTGYAGRFSSVSTMLNLCLTPMGKRQFTYQLLNPQSCPLSLEKIYAMTEFVIEHPSLLTSLHKSLENIKDLSKWNRCLFLQRIAPTQIATLEENLEQIQSLCFTLQNEYPSVGQYLGIENKGISHCKLFREWIHSHLDLKKISCLENNSGKEEQIFLRGVDTQLDEYVFTYMNSLDQVEAVRLYLNRRLANLEKGKKSGGMDSNTSVDYVKIHETEKNQWSLVGTKRRLLLLKKDLPLQEEVVSLPYTSTFDRSEKIFTFNLSQNLLEIHSLHTANDSLSHPFLSFLFSKLTQSQNQIKERNQQLFSQFLEFFKQNQTEMQNIIRFVGSADLLWCQATLAKRYHYCRPRIVQHDSSFVNALGLRHPLIEQIQQSEVYISNDVCLGSGVERENGDKRDNIKRDNINGDNINGILLYGTNAVGKTSLIKSLGIAIIMAQAGLFVPATTFVYSPYHTLFTRILGNDNLFKGLSTFAVEMTELKSILQRANHHSLVLGDELCSGTESISAISIFVAGVETMHKSGCSFMLATHLHEIKDFDEIQGLTGLALKHLSVSYDREKDVLVYDRKLKDGPGNHLYGLEVCKSLHLPHEFIDRANSIRVKYFSQDTGSILSAPTSTYNSQKVKFICEKCQKVWGDEVHHLQFQSSADTDGFIVRPNMTLHKNHVANLMTLCEKCHQEMHQEKTEKKRVKGTKKMQILNIE